MSIAKILPEINGEGIETDQTMTAEELCALLKIKIKRLYESVQRKEIPGHFRIGRQHRFKRKVVLAWLRSDESNPRVSKR